MKKGIVMEKHRQYTIIMTGNGLFLKAKPVGDASIGTEVAFEILEANKRYLFFFRPKEKVKNSFRVIAVTCLLLLFAVPFYFIAGSGKTYAYVNVDINPSVELEIDDQLHVRSVKALNDDAKILVEKLSDYKNKSLEEMVALIMDNSEKSGFIKNGKNVMVGVSYRENSDVSVLDTLDSYFSGHQTDWEIVTFRVPKEIRKTAREKDLSMNKVMAKKLEEKDFPKDVEEKEKLNDEEKAIIRSFYNKDKPKENLQDESERRKKQTEENNHQQDHSKLKDKNGKATSNHKHKENNSERENQRNYRNHRSKTDHDPNQQSWRDKQSDNRKEYHPRDNWDEKHTDKHNHKQGHKPSENKQRKNNHQDNEKENGNYYHNK
ncbi:anti-sigma factor domain-containing protein [Virgibacillus dakarensis]|nr:anti-sigma factor domain-containing protein [Virgibacillus dakarensis]